ncbi:MAG: serine--tRNA ligase [Ignavibacteria bacterium]|nr:serine--tRNA ligase [Ignavibacteria bacterium]
MLDLKFIRENITEVKNKLVQRGLQTDYADVLILHDEKRRKLISETESLKNLRNRVSEEIANLKKQGMDASEKISEMKKVSDNIKKLDEDLKNIETEIDNILRDIPNIQHDSVPVGKTAEENVQIKIYGEKPSGDFRFLDHIELGKKLDILDFSVGAKISGSGFPFYKGKGAVLERALINYMLDKHKENGYTEVFVPFLVNRNSMESAEKVPKFEEDMYRTEPDDMFLVPTAEVPIISIHKNEIIDEKKLPLKYCGYTACFRREAGSYGKETKGFLRVHQFNKVELINFCKADDSYQEMEEMLSHACGILEDLNMHYRVVSVCTGDMGFAAAKQYDIEVWSPAENKWLEASSVSNCTDFQSRRAMIRTRSEGKTEFVHILNGSGLATSRLYVSLIESNQTPEGKVIIPKVLQKYTGFEIIG